MARSPDRRESPISIRLTPDRRAWIESQRQRGETSGATLARLLDEYRLISLSPEVGRTVRALRRLATRIESGDIDA